jgi:hypothetical protein
MIRCVHRIGNSTMPGHTCGTGLTHRLISGTIRQEEVDEQKEFYNNRKYHPGIIFLAI